VLHVPNSLTMFDHHGVRINSSEQLVLYFIMADRPTCSTSNRDCQPGQLHRHWLSFVFNHELNVCRVWESFMHDLLPQSTTISNWGLHTLSWYRSRSSSFSPQVAYRKRSCYACCCFCSQTVSQWCYSLEWLFTHLFRNEAIACSISDRVCQPGQLYTDMG